LAVGLRLHALVLWNLVNDFMGHEQHTESTVQLPSCKGSDAAGRLATVCFCRLRLTLPVWTQNCIS